MLDEDLNVYLMEVDEYHLHTVTEMTAFPEHNWLMCFQANMSPNLSSGHFAANKLLYEQVIINLFSLVGIASPMHGQSVENRLWV